MIGKKNLIRVGSIFFLGLGINIVFDGRRFPSTISQSCNSFSVRRVRIDVADKTAQLKERDFEEMPVAFSDDFYEFANVVQSLFSEVWTGNWLKLFDEIKKIINPHDEPLKGVYIGSGADASTFFLLSNAQTGLFIDKYSLGLEKLQGRSGIEKLISENDMRKYIQEKKVYADGKRRGLYTTDSFFSLLEIYMLR